MTNPTPSQPERPEPPEGYEVRSGGEITTELPEDVYVWDGSKWKTVGHFIPVTGLYYATRTAPEAVAGEQDEFPGNLKGPSPIVREYEGPFAVRGDNPPMVVSKDGESVLSMMWPVHEQTREGGIAAMDYTTKLALRIVDELNTPPEADKDAEKPTPRTDSQRWRKNVDGHEAVLAAFARTLESDLTTARATIAERDKRIAELVGALRELLRKATDAYKRGENATRDLGTDLQHLVSNL